MAFFLLQKNTTKMTGFGARDSRARYGGQAGSGLGTTAVVRLDGREERQDGSTTAYTPRLFRTARTLQLSVTEMCMNRSGLALCLSLSITMAGGVPPRYPELGTGHSARCPRDDCGDGDAQAEWHDGCRSRARPQGTPSWRTCSSPAPDAHSAIPPSFESAGPHLNPAGKQHGLKNPAGPHAGDMNNVTVAADGTAKTTVVNTGVTLGTGSESLSSRGAALVIHAKPDDMKSDPAGNAGHRHRVRRDPRSLVRAVCCPLRSSAGES